MSLSAHIFVAITTFSGGPYKRYVLSFKATLRGSNVKRLWPESEIRGNIKTKKKKKIKSHRCCAISIHCFLKGESKTKPPTNQCLEM